MTGTEDHFTSSKKSSCAVQSAGIQSQGMGLSGLSGLRIGTLNSRSQGRTSAWTPSLSRLGCMVARARPRGET